MRARLQEHLTYSIRVRTRGTGVFKSSFRMRILCIIMACAALALTSGEAFATPISKTQAESICKGKTKNNAGGCAFCGKKSCTEVTCGCTTKACTKRTCDVVILH
jgi:hypothetical protein